MKEYENIVKDFHADLIREDYAAFEETKITPEGKAYFDNSIEEGLMPVIAYAKANNITLDRFVSIAVNLGVKNGLDVSHT